MCPRCCRVGKIARSERCHVRRARSRFCPRGRRRGQVLPTRFEVRLPPRGHGARTIVSARHRRAMRAFAHPALPSPSAIQLETRPDVTSLETPYMRVAQSTETANQVSAGNVTALPNTTRALVAQLDRAPDFESGGRGFEIPPSAPIPDTWVTFLVKLELGGSSERQYRLKQSARPQAQEKGSRSSSDENFRKSRSLEYSVRTPCWNRIAATCASGTRFPRTDVSSVTCL